jgi:nitric oxide reductase NorQ protein
MPLQSRDTAPPDHSFVDPPYFDQLLAAVAAGFPVMLTGPRGTGKTTAVKQIARRFERALALVSGHSDLMVEELRGAMGLRNGDSVFTPGPVTQAVREGGYLLFDECNLCRPGVVAWLNAVIEDDAILALPETGEMIHVPNDFRCFFCFNEGYSGTRDLNEALKDRCRVIFCDYWPKEAEMVLLKTKLPYIADIDARRAIDTANGIRKARREGSIDFDFSIRTLVQWLADAYERTVDLLESFCDVVLPKTGDPLLHEPQHQAMIEIARLVLDE